MRGGKISLNLVAACGLAMTSTATRADHIPGHENCDPVFPVPLPGQEFFDGGVLFGTLIGPVEDSVITNTTFDITYVSDGATPASDLFIEIMVQVDDGSSVFCLTGADLGAAPGPPAGGQAAGDGLNHGVSFFANCESPTTRGCAIRCEGTICHADDFGDTEPN